MSEDETIETTAAADYTDMNPADLSGICSRIDAIIGRIDGISNADKTGRMDKIPDKLDNLESISTTIIDINGNLTLNTAERVASNGVLMIGIGFIIGLMLFGRR